MINDKLKGVCNIMVNSRMSIEFLRMGGIENTPSEAETERARVDYHIALYNLAQALKDNPDKMEEILAYLCEFFSY